MDASLFLQYGWVFIVLVGLEVVLSADNAVVMAVMVKGLEPQAQKKSTVLWFSGCDGFTIHSAVCHIALG
ncbi:hypothetical protein BCAMP_07630 [Brochothrix campestris FSL F6-1037]|uniref:TerC family protein n=1 Tax=Brochothrix campestris FSL F6-1037 TaxID=1265861 RepID=W7CRK0_9LIST|nr:hypothetical protein BCAMP_07630 [Brochothrix campestris FSL F6-1037]